MTVTVVRCTVLLLAAALAVPAIAADKAAGATPAARFKALDANHDGVVSRYEYDGDVAFAVIDSDHDKHISPEELGTFLGDSDPAGAKAAERTVVADLDRDGVLDQNEVYAALETRFKALDRDGDGNLQQAEYDAGFGVRAR